MISQLSGIISLGVALATALVSLSRRNQRPKRTFVMILCLALWSFRRCNELPFGRYLNDMTAMLLLIFLAHQGHLHLLLTQDQLERERRATTPSENYAPKTSDTSVDESFASPPNWRFACKTLFNFRLIGTRWQVPGISEIVGSSSRQPSMAYFLRSRIAAMLGRYLLLCIYWDRDLWRWMPDGRRWTAQDFGQEHRYFAALMVRKITYNVASDSEITRAAFIRMHLLLERTILDYLTISAQYDLCAVIAVATGLSLPSHWPWMFGSIMEAYTVRRYWGIFWHQMLYRSFGTSATWLTAYLKVSRHVTPRTHRSVNHALVFVFSGFLHEIVSRNVGRKVYRSCGRWAELQTCILQMGGIMAEEMVQSYFYRAVRPLTSSTQVRYSRFWHLMAKVLGYVWVISWHILVLEMTRLPTMLCQLNTASSAE